MTSGLSLVAELLVLWWVVAGASIWFAYRRVVARLWREPVWRFPVLVLDSDDWGAGPPSQVPALNALAEVLARFRDASGHRPVMNLAVVLAVPDGPAMSADASRYARWSLDRPPLDAVADALKRGEADGVFALQLHGMEHFLPDTLLTNADPAVRAWQASKTPASTEDLPPPLQARWVDAQSLPSRALPAASIQSAVAEEVQAYRRIFGRVPAIVVPPAFVWTTEVERAWASQGVEGLMTPGERYTALAGDGSLLDDGARIANGDRTNGLTCLVRCDYFEPARGRDADYALRALRLATDDARPCVLENHRVNFCRDANTRVRSLQEIERLLAGALVCEPRLRFLGAHELLTILQHRPSTWLRTGWVARFAFLLQRLRGTGRLWKLLRLAGIAMPVTLLAACARTLEPRRG